MSNNLPPHLYEIKGFTYEHTGSTTCTHAVRTVIDLREVAIISQKGSNITAHLKSGANIQVPCMSETAAMEHQDTIIARGWPFGSRIF